MTRSIFKWQYIAFFVVVMLIGMVDLGYGRSPIPEPPPGVQDPYTYNLTGPSFLAKIKMWKVDDTHVDLLITGTCANYSFNPDATKELNLPIPTTDPPSTWADLDKEWFESYGFDTAGTVLAIACGWAPNHYGTEWIVLSPVAVTRFVNGVDEDREFIELSVVYLGRLLSTLP